MRAICFSIFFLIPFFSVSQSINYVDNIGMKQGVWQKKYANGNIRYEGTFKDNKEIGLFRYFYEDGSLKLEKIFFHNSTAASAHFYYKNGDIKSSGLYVNSLKDSTWNYYDFYRVRIMTEQYKNGKLNGVTKTFIMKVLSMK